MSAGFRQAGHGNDVRIGSGVELTGWLQGNGNQILIADTEGLSRLHVQIHGNDNRIVIGRNSELNGLVVCCGNHVAAHGTELRIGDETSIEPGGRFYLYNSGNRLHIGSECMLSNHITVRCGESPHLIFERDSGAYLDVSEGVFIGNHVWVGESVYITKAASVGDDCIVGACSVLTKRFDTTHAALAGNPARVVREGVQWVRNPGLLVPGSRFDAAYRARTALFDGQGAGASPSATDLPG